MESKSDETISNLFSNQFISVPVRLAGSGSSKTEGYVEAINTTSGLWGGVCDNSFDILDAHVICKMLGYPTAIEALANSAADDLYGTPLVSNFVLNNLACTGLETSVFDCRLTGESNDNCEAFEIAGVICATSKLLI